MKNETKQPIALSTSPHSEEKIKGKSAQSASKMEGIEVIHSASDADCDKFNKWNATEKTLPEYCVHELFEEQVKRNPDAPAAIFQREVVSYGELNDRANQLAHYLKENCEIGPDKLIGLCMTRSVDMFIGLIAILKAGGAYVPLDPSYPVERLQHMLRDSELSTVLTQTAISNSLPFDGKNLILLDSDALRLQLQSYSTRNLPKNELSGNSLAYAIFTSGSTGLPKAVLLEHKGLINLSLTFAETFGVNEHAKMLQFASISFDAATLEWATALTMGASLILLEKNPAEDLAHVSDIVETHQVTHAILTPSLLAVLPIERWHSVHTLAVGGDICGYRQAQRWSQGRKFFNAYGPTEITVCCSMGRFDGQGLLTIGGPVANTEYYVLSQEGTLLPIGMPGELYVASAGIARGYLNRPELTKERFVVNPFSPEKYSHLYRTGDLVRWLDEGNLEFLGRIDLQVKIRGFRIELGEIETVIASHPQVKEALVIAKDDAEDGKKLVAYYLGRAETSDVRKHAADKLPEHMVPSAFVMLDSWPLTPNGKIDRRALPEPKTAVNIAAYATPQSSTEHTLAELWQQILAVSIIGIDDHFSDLGGHSLKLALLAGRIEAAFGIRISLKNLFKHPTVRTQAHYLDAALANDTVSKASGPSQLITKTLANRVCHTITHAQTRWLLSEKMYPDTALANMPFSVRVRNPDFQKLEQAINRVVARNDGLRLRFVQDAYEFYQYVAAPEYRQFECVDLTSETWQTWAHAHAAKPIPWENSELAQFTLMKLSEHEGGFFANAHHAIGDGWSMRMLLNDIVTEYTCLIEEKPAAQQIAPSFLDAVQNEGNYLASEEARHDQVFWQDQLHNYSGQTTLPFVRHLKTNVQARHEEFTLPPDLAKKIRLLCKELDTTFYRLVLAAMYCYVGQTTNQDDLVIGIVTHNRREEVDRITQGVYINTLPLRQKLDQDMGFDTFLHRVQDDLRTVLEQRARYPYDLLVKDLRARTGKVPDLLNIIVAGAGQAVTVPGADVQYHHPGVELPPYHLILNVASTPEPQLIFITPAGMYTDEDLQSLREHIVHILGQIVETPDLSLAQLRTFNANTAQASAQIDMRPENYFPLSPAQQRLYWTEQLESTGLTYCLPITLELQGELDVPRLEQALRNLIQRHEPLRTRFPTVDDQVVQQIAPASDIHISLAHDIEQVDANDLRTIVQRFLQRLNLAQGPLLQVKLLRLEAKRHALLLNIHHTIFDGSSISILVKELSSLYANQALPELSTHYREHAMWINHWLSSAQAKEHENFWLTQFPDSVPVLDLPTDFPRPANIDTAGVFHKHRLDGVALKNFANRSGTTPYVVILSTFSILLAKYCNQDDIVIGTGTAGRHRAEIQNLIGMFVNTLPVRCFPEKAKLVSEYLSEMQAHILDVLEHQDYPFERLIERLNIKRETSRRPLFDVALVYQNTDHAIAHSSDLGISAMPFNTDCVHTDLLLEITEELDGTLVLNWGYRTSLFNTETIARMADHFVRLLEGIYQRPEDTINQLSLLSAQEEQQLLFDFNETHANWPQDKTVHRIFEEIVERFPNRIAVTCGDASLSYAVLNTKANQLARKLRDMGAKPDMLIGILLDRGIEQLVTMLAVLKSGAAYLPIISEYPKERIEYMLEHSGAPILLSDTALAPLAEQYHGHWINAMDESLYQGEDSNLAHVNQPSDLIYTIYTSGSTGRPKGVMLEHRQIVRLFINDKMDYAFDENDVWSLFHSFSFDFSVWEIFGALLYGGRVVVVPQRIAKDPGLFFDLCNTEGVTVLSQTPGAFYHFVDAALKSNRPNLALRYVTFGGEALKPRLLGEWRQKFPSVHLINMYGITETTVHVTFKEVIDEDIAHGVSNIGHPIPTLRTYVMDADLRLQPIGVPGEICVAGDGLARGYLGQPDITAQRFVENPYISGERIYRSGDLARMLPNGELEYLGRIDFQVKIRGFRIELGEIENQLLTYPLVNKAIVLARQNASGDRTLVAYYTASEELNSKELKQYLRSNLPDYMTPGFFVQMEQFPLTVNGKIDRNVLPPPSVGNAASVELEQLSPTEEMMLPIWCKVLGLEHISVQDDFFALGGHSMRAVALASELQKHFEVTVNDIFEFPTIRKLAAHAPQKVMELRDKIRNIEGMLARRKENTQAYLSHPEVAIKLSAYSERAKQYAQLSYGQLRSYREVLLTGATGYLGVYLLKTLLSEKTSNVTLILRAQDDAHALQRLRTKCDYYFGAEFFPQFAHRITVRRGDLSSANLGLNQQDYSEFANRIDCVLHAAALVKHYGHYDEFHRANVDSVTNLVEFSRIGCKKNLHHISTLSVADGDAPNIDHLVFDEFHYDLGQRSTNYYVQTKLEAEMEVLKARELGINAHIYRVGNISIHSETGHLQENLEENAFYQQLQAFVNLGVVPVEDDEVEFSFVDQLSTAVVLLMECGTLTNETFHLWNNHVVKLSELLIDPALELDIEPVGIKEFLNILHDHYDQTELRQHIDAVMLHRGWMGAISSTKDAISLEKGFTILSDKTQLILEKLGFSWKKLDMEAIGRLIHQARSE